MEPSFREKSQWVQFVTLLSVFAFYFISVLPSGAVDVAPEQVLLFIGMVVLLVIAQIVGHTILAIADREHDTDERDRQIELRSVRNAAYVLSTGVFISLSAAVMVEGNFFFTHLLLGAWVFAQLTEIGSRIAYYRRGF